jgi:ABC-type transporter Mla maintaining outer membrane lipid asymmetry ATPase subunit MlaF
VVVLARGRVIADGPVREVAALDDPWIRSYFAVRRTVTD